METVTMSAGVLKAALRNFTGTEAYHQHRSLGKCSILLTDGCHYLAEKAQCYWLVDLIMSYQHRKDIADTLLQVWILKKQEDNTWTVHCTDGNYTVLARQDIEHSDFPLDEIKLWYADSVLMLPSEY